MLLTRFLVDTRLALCASALVLLAFPARSSGASETDLVVFASGNRMTGQVTELSRGELAFSVDGAGSIDIDWNNVVSLRSVEPLDIELASGELMTGSIESVAQGLLQVTTDTGRKNVRMSDVIRMQPHAATFRARTSGDIDLGFDFLTAHDEIDWTLNASVEHRTKKYLSEVSLSSLVRRHDGETSQQRNHLEFESRRLLEQRWFAVGLLEAEEDDELDLDLRVLVGAAMGRTLVRSHRTALAMYAGVDVSHEEYAGVSDYDDDVAELLVALQWEWFEVGGDVEAVVEATAYISPDDGRRRLQLESSLRRSLVRDFYWSLNLYESYNSDPPPGLEKSDLGVSITLGRSF
jgi:Protein of unknown function, DUF481